MPAIPPGRLGLFTCSLDHPRRRQTSLEVFAVFGFLERQRAVTGVDQRSVVAAVQENGDCWVFSSYREFLGRPIEVFTLACCDVAALSSGLLKTFYCSFLLLPALHAHTCERTWTGRRGGERNVSMQCDGRGKLPFCRTHIGNFPIQSPASLIGVLRLLKRKKNKKYNKK